MSADELALYDDLCSDDRHRIERATRLLTRQVKALATRTVTGNSGTIHDVDDLVQDVVLAVWQQMRTGRFQPQAGVPLGAYLRSVVWNNWLKVLRERRQHVPAEIDEGKLNDLLAPTTQDDPRIDRLERAFLRLGAACQRVLRLFYWEGYAMEEIAEQVGTTIDATKQRKYRCMLTLGTLLGE
ncbi:RNA polymerase sigma factor [Fibrella sp. WM1]|uniref:RNA polymerase sigma factor n=1 Tax=Fibrella musci TaxID=3242485 RepID=UPI003522FBBC